ncbi:MAG: hypothetical protein JST39_17300 [Bacteroidetes bacterium]|nr:hypothetical protein [Bacteroidota bacterium]
MKNFVYIVLALALSAGAVAQGVFTNQTNGALEKVIQDYPNQFKNIKGDLLASSPKESEYKSNVVIPGAESSTVITCAERHLVSWQTVLYSNADFDKVETKFKELYGQIKNTIVRIEGERPVILNGKYETPEEGRAHTTVAFDILPVTGTTRQLKVDLTIRKRRNGHWMVLLSVYDSDRREEELIVSNTEN